MNTTEVTIAAGDVTLAGTLVLPDEPKAIVIFVHGSGPMDRDQNSKYAKLNIFNSLAAELARSGVASLRYDKRGVGGSGGVFDLLGQADLIADLAACIAWVHAKDLGPVYLCGHSEGTAIAPAAAVGADVAGLVLICPYLTPGDALLRWQAAQMESALQARTGLNGLLVRGICRLFGGPVRMQNKLIDRVLEGTRDYVRVGGKRVPRRWMHDFITTDVAAVHRANTRPTLVLVAGRDCQCPPDDGAMIASFHETTELIRIDDLSHLLRQTTQTGFDDYARQLTMPMDPRIGAGLCDWVGRQSAVLRRE